MSVVFNLRFVPVSGQREIFAVQQFSTIAAKSSCATTVKCRLNTAAPTDLMGKIKHKLNWKLAVTVHPLSADNDIPCNLCIIDTLERLGVHRYFQTEIHTVLEQTYRLWQRKDKAIFSDITTHAMAFRLLRVKGYQVSSEELAPYADQERVTIDVPTVIELYRASQERIYEEENSLEKLHAWTTTFLNHQLLTNSIPDIKLHKQVEYYLKNYHGIPYRMAVRRSLDLYDIGHYPTLKVAADRFPNLCNEDFLEFARQDFNICQAQHRKELEQLQRLDTLKFGREAIHDANFMASTIIGDPELSNVHLALAKLMVLVTRIDDYLVHSGSKEDSYKLLESVEEWKEKPATEYGDVILYSRFGAPIRIPRSI